MPPEQLPWDRRDFRKHERSASDPRFVGGGGGFGGRWRDHHHPNAPPPPSPHPQPYHHHQNPQQQQRWYSDFRSSRPIPTAGHGKHGGWHLYPDEVDHGFTPFGSRHNGRSLDDDSLRPLGFRGDGRYLRNSRENRGVFGHKEWRSPNGEISAGSSGPGKLTVDVTNQMPLENTSCHDNQTKSSDSVIPATVLPLEHKSDLNKNSEDGRVAEFFSRLSQNSAPSSGLGKPNVELNNHKPPVGSMSISCDKNGKCNDPASDAISLPSDQHQPILKEKPEEFESADCVTKSSQKSEKENMLGSIDWKPLKWSRSGSLSSRCSAFSNSNISKSTEVHHNEIGADLQPDTMMPIDSSAADASVASIAPSPSDITNPRKKPRLGWGEGLAKYERKKVEVPENVTAKEGPSSIPDTETLHSPSVELMETSPTVACLSISPTTPCSVACSFSPGFEDNDPIKAVAVDQMNASIKSSPSVMPQPDNNEQIFNLERIDDLSSIANLSNLINELLHSNGPGSVETDYVKSTALNKLLVWRANVLKVLEVTESEIDSLETKSKSLLGDARSCIPQPSVPELSIGDCSIKPYLQMDNASSFTTEPNISKPSVTGDLNIDNPFTRPEVKIMVPTDEDIQSPHCALPTLVDSSPSELSFKASDCVEYLTTKPFSSCSFDQICCKNLDRIYDSIISSNKDSANKVSGELNMLQPSQWHNADISTSTHVSSMSMDSLNIKKKIMMRRRALKFNEKILILKYNVLQHFWKQGRVVSLRKIKGKSHKKFDLGEKVCTSNHSSSHSRLPYSAGSLLTVPAEELIDLVNSLLSKFPFKQRRSTLKMPPLILDRQTKKSKFISNNGLVDDPLAAETERSIINPWTAQETELFIDKLAIFGKDFKRIASFLDHKTIADCVEFYYKNHKSECFSRAKRKSDSTKKKSYPSTYLLGPGKRLYQDSNAVSLDILGEVAKASTYIENQPKYKSQMFSSRYQISPRGDENTSRLPANLDFYNNETAAVDVLAGICGSLSSEAMSSCITSSIDPVDGNQDRKLPRNINLCVKCPLTPDVTQCIGDSCSDESCDEIDSVDWTDEEKSLFIQAVSSYGKDFLTISRFMRTRSRDQCKVFFSKAHKCLGLDVIRPTAAYAVFDSDNEVACVNGNDSSCNISSDRKDNYHSCAGTCNSDTHVKDCEENTVPLDIQLTKENDIKSTHEPIDEQCKGFFAASSACDDKIMLKDSDWSDSKEKLSSDEVTESRDIVSCVSNRMMFNEPRPVDADSNVKTLSESMDSSSKLFPVPIKYQRNSFNTGNHQIVVDAVHSKRKIHPRYLRNGDVRLFGKILVSSEPKPSFVRDVISGTEPDCAMLKKCCVTETQSPRVKNNGDSMFPNKVLIGGNLGLARDTKQSLDLLYSESLTENEYDTESGMIDRRSGAQCSDPIDVINTNYSKTQSVSVRGYMEDER